MKTATTGACIRAAQHALTTGQPNLAALYMRRGLHEPAADTRDQ